MLGCHHASSALTLFMVLLVGTSFLPLSTQIPINAPGFDSGSRHNRAATPGLAAQGAGDTAGGRGDEMSSLPKGGAAGEEGEEEDDDDDELFKDVDPKTLAALLLEALNKPQAERRTDGGHERERTEEEKAEPAAEATKAEEEGESAARATERENRDRDHDGRHELELVMAAAAAQGKEERERQEEEERKKKQEEEERMTERVTSRTTSQTVPVKTEKASDASDGGGEEEAVGAPPARPRTPAAAGDPRQSNEEEEEEQLSPEEVQNLERMMKKFQSYSAATKRERDSQVGERESRGGFSPYNEIHTAHKAGADLATSKKKLKWQEETQKAMHVPTFKGGNFMDDFQDNNDLDDSTPLPGNDAMEQDEPEGEEDDEEEEEEVLSPAEEEARAKADQEEVRRQAAEAQRAKAEEEKLADIASDMLLQYMVKQNGGGNRRYGKYSSSSPQSNNAAEDKRSDEEQEAVMDEDEDIDPQTIDKLIEISSKLHLPADDVVDIISDVEKKKKKDVAPEMGWSPPPRQRPLMPMSSSQSSSSMNGISASQMAAALNSVPSSSKQDPLAVNPLKAWFLETPPSKSSLANEDFWTKPQKPLSTAQDFWLKPQKSFRASYSPYTPYTSYYQQKPYRGYYPIYFPPPPQSAKPRYYVPKPALTLNNLLGSSAADYGYNFGPKQQRFRNWVQVRPRKPPASLRRNPYYADYVYSSYPRTFQPAAVPIPKLRSPPRLAGGAPPRRRSGFYYRPPAAPAMMTRGGGDYYNGLRRNQADDVDDANDRLESYIQQILMKRPQMVQ